MVSFFEDWLNLCQFFQKLRKISDGLKKKKLDVRKIRKQTTRIAIENNSPFAVKFKIDILISLSYF